MVVSDTPLHQRLLGDRRRSDALLAVCLVGVAIVGAVAGADDEAGSRNPSAWWEWMLVVAPSVPVAFRRSDPGRAVVASVSGQILVWVTGLSTALLAPLVLIYSVTSEGDARLRRLAILASAALTATAVVGVFSAPDVTPDLMLLTALSCAVAYVLGVTVADQRAAAADLAAQLAIADVERAAAQERAATSERQRVAREVHDIVGHSLSVIAVRSEAATRVGAKDPSAAVDAASAITSIARSALADVRRVLSGLREEGADVELAPTATLGDLPALISATEDAGVSIELVRPLPNDDGVGAAVAVSAYRIVQESLTNVIRHAGADPTVRLDVAHDGSVLTVVVEDDGREVIGDEADRGGTGLTGMRERVAVLGGSIESGGRPGGGFRVAARLPLQPVEAVR